MLRLGRVSLGCGRGKGGKEGTVHNNIGFHVIEGFGYGGGVAEVEGEDRRGGTREARSCYGPVCTLEGGGDLATKEACGACYEGALRG